MKTTKIAVLIALAACLTALTCGAAVITWWAWHVGQEAQLAVAAVRTTADQATVLLADPQIGRTLTVASSTLDTIGEAARAIPPEIQEIRKPAARAIDQYAAAGRAVEEVLKAARPAVDAAKDVAEEIAEEMDCDPETGLGAACLPNHYIGTLQSTDRAMRAIAAAAPAVSQNVAAISGHAATVSEAASEWVPQMLATGQQTNSEIKGIAADARKLADRLTAPKSTGAKVRDALWLALRGAALFW